MKITIILTLFSALWIWPASYAQGNIKHPKVIELEDKLEQDAYRFLERRYPAVPFNVQVDIDPLRRTNSDYKEGEGEALPYFEVDKEEVQDEWDNPYLSVYQLLPRITKTRVDMTVPMNMTADEISDLKNDLLNFLNLIPGRDELRITKKEWRNLEQKEKRDYITEFMIFVVSLFFLLGLFLILKSTSKTLASSMGGPSAKPSTGVSSVGPASFSSAKASPSSKHKSDDFSGDLQLRDPIKLKEIAKVKIEELEKDENFPLLSDMILMYRLAQTHPGSLGGLVYEFSINVQRKIFTLGRDNLWYEVFSEPSKLDDYGLNILDRMLRLREHTGSKMWGHLLIQIWRLNEEAESFLTQLQQNEVFAILSDMPKSFAIPLARKIYPGSWGLLLNKSKGSEAQEVDSERIKELFKMSVRLKPRLDIQTLNEYNKDKDLIAYLKYADLTEERDVYVTLGEQSLLYGIRPPFFKIFEGPEEVLKEIVSSYGLDTWAKALFNGPREYRYAITDHLDEKMSYLLGHHLKAIDAQKLDKDEQAQIREEMAARFAVMMDLYNRKKQEDSANEGPQDLQAEMNEMDSDNEQAA